MSEFDSKAREWDKEKMHTERSVAIAQAMKEAQPLSPAMKALEYGAGTGLLSFELKDKLDSITLVDTSAEMIAVCNEKISASNVKNLVALKTDILHENFNRTFHLIYNQMVLHHVNNTKAILAKFHELLLPGGYLAIADLYLEDGSFHGFSTDVHPGFDPEILSEDLNAIGFKKIYFKPCFTITKKIEENKSREFPVFLLTAKKS